MPSDWWMDKENVEHIYNGILLNHDKGWNWVIFTNDKDEPRVCHTKWSKSEREKQMSYVNAYIWNLENWYWWTYLHGSNRDTDVEDGLVDTVGEKRGWDKLSSNDIYTLPWIK